jgi:hypothetical protein
MSACALARVLRCAFYSVAYIMTAAWRATFMAGAALIRCLRALVKRVRATLCARARRSSHSSRDLLNLTASQPQQAVVSPLSRAASISLPSKALCLAAAPSSSTAVSTKAVAAPDAAPSMQRAASMLAPAALLTELAAPATPTKGEVARAAPNMCSAVLALPRQPSTLAAAPPSQPSPDERLVRLTIQPSERIVRLQLQPLVATPGQPSADGRLVRAHLTVLPPVRVSITASAAPPCAAAVCDQQHFGLAPAAAEEGPSAAPADLAAALVQLSSAEEAAAALLASPTADEGEPSDSQSAGESDSDSEGEWDLDSAFVASCGRGNGCSASIKKEPLTRNQTVRKLHSVRECEADAVAEAEAVAAPGTPQKMLSRVTRWPSRSERRAQDLTGSPAWEE